MMEGGLRGRGRMSQRRLNREMDIQKRRDMIVVVRMVGGEGEGEEE